MFNISRSGTGWQYMTDSKGSGWNKVLKGNKQFQKSAEVTQASNWIDRSLTVGTTEILKCGDWFFLF